MREWIQEWGPRDEATLYTVRVCKNTFVSSTNYYAITYRADNFVSMIPSIKHIHWHVFILLVNIVSIARLRRILGVNTKQIAAQQHNNTTNDDYGVDVRSRVSNKPGKKNMYMVSILIRQGWQGWLQAHLGLHPHPPPSHLNLVHTYRKVWVDKRTRVLSTFFLPVISLCSVP